jgi:tetratricopeptide (TPR) repeat protein
MMSINIFLFAQLNTEQQELIKQYTQKIKDFKANNQLKEAANYCNKRAFVYMGASKYEEAISSYIESTEMNNKIGNDADNKKIYNNIAMIYAEMNQMNNSLKYFEKSLVISRRNNNKNEIAVSLMDISTILMYNKQYDDAIRYLEEALKISNDQDNMSALISCYDLLSQSYKATGNVKKSDEYYKQYLALDQLRKEGKSSIANKSDNFLAAESENLNKYVPVEKEEYFSNDIINKQNVQNLKKHKDSLIAAISASKEEQRKLLEEYKKYDNETVKEKIELETTLVKKEQTILYLILSLTSIIAILIGIGTFLLFGKQKEIKILREKLSKYEDKSTS